MPRDRGMALVQEKETVSTKLDDPDAAALARADWIAFLARYEHAHRARVAARRSVDVPRWLGARVSLWLWLAMSVALWSTSAWDQRISFRLRSATHFITPGAMSSRSYTVDCSVPESFRRRTSCSK